MQEHIANKTSYGCTMSQVALAWVNNKIASPIVGLNSVERVDESLVGVVLRREDVEYLEEAWVSFLFLFFWGLADAVCWAGMNRRLLELMLDAGILHVEEQPNLPKRSIS